MHEEEDQTKTLLGQQHLMDSLIVIMTCPLKKWNHIGSFKALGTKVEDLFTLESKGCKKKRKWPSVAGLIFLLDFENGEKDEVFGQRQNWFVKLCCKLWGTSNKTNILPSKPISKSQALRFVMEDLVGVEYPGVYEKEVKSHLLRTP
ncbi:hypothetical protein C5167_040906 [Papaver somniferum]|uniref:Uncharacterized protein n=1 Tax=Papaver somniferum TaxID=3469 RepID=A0A4Y7IGB3_PAPSO|nr:hypothetical protein C5167_040906 [Papaver somniferum]